MKGVVIESTGSWYKVQSDEGGDVECRLRGRLRLRGTRSTNPVVVGDRVEYETDEEGQNLIIDIEERRNYLIRRSPNLSKESHIIAANVDRAFVVVSLFRPETNREFLDRFLVTCEAYHIPAIIILNKIDLARVEPQLLTDFNETYALTGYRVIETCAIRGEGIGEIRRLVANGTSLFAGNSGVGKSTIIKAVEPSAAVTIGRISDSHNKGMHTTTYSRIYSVNGGGRIIDTPGIKGFGLIDIGMDELWHYFPEFMRESAGCQYYNCTHTHEPGCAVREAVEQGHIAVSRYESYLKIMDEDGKYR